MTLAYQDYLKMDKLPHMWCSGCGDGIVVRAIAEALTELNLEKDKVVIATGIGCWGKADDYFTTHAFHGTHGRALPYATGIKLANPDVHVLVLMGDGDAATIGGNHFIHAARRNIDLTAIVVNNFNYGMTGGQYSATTPLAARTSTSPKGVPEPGFDVSNLAEAAGANFVARTTAYHAVNMRKLIVQAMTKKGFSLVEVLSSCPTYFGRYNGYSPAVNMMKYLRELGVPKAKYEQLPEKEKEEHFPTGVLTDKDREDFLTIYKRLNNVKMRGGTNG
ncbi:thiamine pyrophosphate-dependent enzyme [Metallumcola ferriviriculae]|uniref:Thiamine pyrophosphate-dependent enzyme n=1 Tax=Metallumcola ferriviriculae TaxID=3039180 RepID=A0AAU0UU16_9FIRM|nr:thiamine pyrophosphate-dependent enzyme [Desulfitibacteraceae bacterium MK1]